MLKELEVDSNLYHLLEVLYYLNYYKFDSDITKILNDLKSLVDKKVFKDFDFEDYNIVDEKLILKYYLEK